MSCQIVFAGELGSTAWFVTNEVVLTRRVARTGMPPQIREESECSSTIIMTTLMWLEVNLKMTSEEPLVCWYMGLRISKTSSPKTSFVRELLLADRAYERLARCPKRRATLDSRLEQDQRMFWFILNRRLPNGKPWVHSVSVMGVFIELRTGFKILERC